MPDQAPSPTPAPRRFSLPPSLLRCAATSLAAVTLEFMLLTFFVSVMHLHYFAGALMATSAYLVINFILNRKWAFKPRDPASPPRWQFARHVGVSAIGTGMALGMLRFFVHTIGLPYQVGWLAAGCINFGTWTYPMNRLFTFGSAA